MSGLQIGKCKLQIANWKWSDRSSIYGSPTRPDCRCHVFSPKGAQFDSPGRSPGFDVASITEVPTGRNSREGAITNCSVPRIPPRWGYGVNDHRFPVLRPGLSNCVHSGLILVVCTTHPLVPVNLQFAICNGRFAICAGTIPISDGAQILETEVEVSP